MPIAVLNRDKLRQLCESRLEEARVLLEQRHWTGAYYFTGLAVECAVKAYLAGTVKQHDFPDRKFVNDMYVHNLESLLKVDGALQAELEKDMRTDRKLATNWTTVKDWDDGKRYDVVEELAAKDLYQAATEVGSGVLEWLRRRW